MRYSDLRPKMLCLRVSEARELVGTAAVFDELVANHGLSLIVPRRRGEPALVDYQELQSAYARWRESRR